MAIISDFCDAELFENFNLGAEGCLPILISKMLGIVIIIASAMLKVPQILVIVNAKSAKGVNITMFYSEILAFTITICFNIVNGSPLTTYAECYLILIQDFVLVLLIRWYGDEASVKPHSLFDPVFVAMTVVYAAVTGGLVTGALDEATGFPVLDFCQSLNVPLVFASRLPQIVQNHQSKSTGGLSIITFALNALGGTVRTWTTFVEAPEFLLLLPVALSSSLNWIIVTQIILYAPAATDAKKEK
mmetsp:Transcript_28423/g.79455  ORF Transcript_28423/g.79455 Transcript_28423/m.79455 type:complete len:245 (+) Transcript_28423:98-832(+)